MLTLQISIAYSSLAHADALAANEHKLCDSTALDLPYEELPVPTVIRWHANPIR